MNIGVVGSRIFNDYLLLAEWLNHFRLSCHVRVDLVTIISGGAKGADSLAEDYAENWGMKSLVFKPDWEKYGKSAGFKRNQDIVDNSDMVVAFWDGKSKGTQDSINKARAAKKPTFIVYF